MNEYMPKCEKCHGTGKVRNPAVMVLGEDNSRVTPVFTRSFQISMEPYVTCSDCKGKGSID